MNDYRRLCSRSYHDAEAIAQNRFSNNLLAIGNAVFTLAIAVFLAAVIYALL